MSLVDKGNSLNKLKKRKSNINLYSKFTLYKKVNNIFFNQRINILQDNKKKLNFYKNVLSNNAYSLIKENQKNSLNIDPISTITNNNRLKKNFSSENYIKFITKNIKNGKSRNSNNQNLTHTTIVNNTINTNTNNTILTQNINKTINNDYLKEKKKKNEIFTLNSNCNKSTINKEKYKSRNGFLKMNKIKNSSCFSEKEKNKIYKTYFSVENIRKKTKKIIIANEQNNFTSLNNRIVQKKRNASTNYKVNNIQKIENFYIPSKKDLIKELNKFKKKIHKLKTSKIEMEKKLKSIKEENKKIKLYILNTCINNNRNNDTRKSTIYKKSRLIDLIYSYSNNNTNIGNKIAIGPSGNNQLLQYDSFDKIKELKKKYKEKKVINDIINLMKNFYLEYNYSFSSNEAKKIINSKDISTKLLWNWFKNVPKLLFYENIKNNLNENQKTSKKYKEFIESLYHIFGVKSFSDLKDKINKIISYYK